MLISFILLAWSTSAATLIDITTNQPIADSAVYVQSESGPHRFYTVDGSVELDLSEGEVVIQTDNFATESFDYYGKFVVDDESSGSFYLHPVGSVRGVVVDKLNNLVNGARLKCECDGPPESHHTTTDEYGSFYIANLPVKSCKILANYQGIVGSTDVQIEHGQRKEIKIVLEESLVAKKDIPWNTYLIAVGTLLIVMISILLIFRPRKRKTVPKEKDSLTLGKRASDIIKTLPKSHREIIHFTAQQGGHTTSSKIYYHLGLPKSSLFRHLQSLCIRNIIKIKKTGKRKNIRFTNWFLGKE